MNKIIVFWILTLLLVSCTNPADINSPKDKTPVDTLDYKLLFNPQILDFGFVKPGDSTSLFFSVTNQTRKELKIKGFDFSNKTNFFYEEFDTDIFLAPEQSDGDSQEFEIFFKAHNPGYYRDTLSVKGYSEPVMHPVATVPSVYPEDIEFGEYLFEQDKIYSDKLFIYNENNLPIAIDTVIFEDRAVSFSDTPVFPIEVPAKSYILKLIDYKPKSPGVKESKLLLRVSESVIVDTSATIKAVFN